MDKSMILVIVFLGCVLHLSTAATGFFNALIQNNLSGKPVIHVNQSWKFDPDAGVRRRAEFQAAHGYRGEKLIERFGLGEDGRTEERRQQQLYRDSIGALSYKVPE